MGRFYLDMEFTNGNYFLMDMLEIPLVEEECGTIAQIWKDTPLDTKAGASADGDYK